MSGHAVWPRAAVLLLGTFHFRDAGLDVYKPQHGVDILSLERQAQIEELVERLARFRPTKVAVEGRPEKQAQVDADYAAYRAGRSEAVADELHQIAFRLARRQVLERVHGVDAWGRYYDPPIDLEEHARGRSTRELGEYLEKTFSFDPASALRGYARDHAQEQLLEHWAPRMAEFLEDRDVKKTQESLRETLLRLNDEDTLRQLQGAYLTDWFKVGTGREYPGADFVTAWYNRNLRIFANIQRITESSAERIFVLFGVGHVPILRHCFQSSPEYELAEAKDYLA